MDLGCGTGQNTRLLAPHFQKVVGIDVSESQVEEARALPGFANVTYRSAIKPFLLFVLGVYVNILMPDDTMCTENYLKLL